MTTKVLNRRQARWAQELAGYDFCIYFRPGKLNGKADYLSRRPEHRLKEEGNDKREPETIFKVANFAAAAISLITPLPEISSAGEGLRYKGSSARICSIPMTQWSKTFLDEVRAEAANDPQYQQGLKAVAEHEANTSNPVYPVSRTRRGDIRNTVCYPLLNFRMYRGHRYRWISSQDYLYRVAAMQYG